MINPHANQVKKSDSNDCCTDNSGGPKLPVAECRFGPRRLTAFQSFFVDTLTMIIFDPGGVSPVPLPLNNLKRAIRVVGLGFDCPIPHGVSKTDKRPTRGRASKPFNH
jgi:hypothetical protein